MTVKHHPMSSHRPNVEMYRMCRVIVLSVYVYIHVNVTLIKQQQQRQRKIISIKFFFIQNCNKLLYETWKCINCDVFIIECTESCIDPKSRQVFSFYLFLLIIM